jgi:hypothetical protein
VGRDIITQQRVYSKWLPAYSRASLREAVAVGTCGGHPNIVKLLDCFRAKHSATQEDKIVLVFEQLYITIPLSREMCAQWLKQLLKVCSQFDFNLLFKFCLFSCIICVNNTLIGN